MEDIKQIVFLQDYDGRFKKGDSLRVSINCADIHYIKQVESKFFEAEVNLSDLETKKIIEII